MTLVPILFNAGVPDAGHDFRRRGGPVGIQLGFPDDLGDDGGAFKFGKEDLESRGGLERFEASGGEHRHDADLLGGGVEIGLEPAEIAGGEGKQRGLAFGSGAGAEQIPDGGTEDGQHDESPSGEQFFHNLCFLVEYRQRRRVSMESAAKLMFLRQGH